jgi:lipopolysaccharide export system permease protein
MSRIDRYILKAFVTVFLKTLGISVFFLLMQMVWKYVDDLAGKGIDWLSIMEWVMYWSVSVLPMAVPVAVLYAGIMTYGDLAESNELAAAKSGGSSFYRMLRPAVLACSIIAVGMFYVSNNLIPVANFKGENLLLNIAKQKPTFNLSPGVFYGGISGYSIKIGQKTGSTIHDVMIYRHQERGDGNLSMITAPLGELNYVSGSPWMELNLFDGHSYEEQKNQKNKAYDPYVESEFKHMVLRFNMRDFQVDNLYAVNRSDEFNMLNINQLAAAIKELKKSYAYRKSEVATIMHHKFYGWESAKTDTIPLLAIDLMVANRLKGHHQYRAVNNGIHLMQSNKEYMQQVSSEYRWRDNLAARHYLEWHKKFAIAMACILLFFIGAPLGAIIQKGGFGLPFVISVLLFLTHYVLTMVFEKMGRDWVIDPFWAIWMPNLLLLPIAMWMTHWAANDASTHSFVKLSRLPRWLYSKLNPDS